MRKADKKRFLGFIMGRSNAEGRWTNSKGSGSETMTTQRGYVRSPKAIVKAWTSRVKARI